jgi:hypothetical protein
MLQHESNKWLAADGVANNYINYFVFNTFGTFKSVCTYTL